MDKITKQQKHSRRVFLARDKNREYHIFISRPVCNARRWKISSINNDGFKVDEPLHRMFADNPLPGRMTISVPFEGGTKVYLARDNDGSLTMYDRKPTLYPLDGGLVWIAKSASAMALPQEFFGGSVTASNSPVEASMSLIFKP